MANYTESNLSIFPPRLPADPRDLAELRKRNNPQNEPVGDHTGRCAHCGSNGTCGTTTLPMAVTVAAHCSLEIERAQAYERNRLCLKHAPATEEQLNRVAWDLSMRRVADAARGEFATTWSIIGSSASRRVAPKHRPQGARTPTRKSMPDRIRSGPAVHVVWLAKEHHHRVGAYAEAERDTSDEEQYEFDRHC